MLWKILRVSWTEHRTNQAIDEEHWVTSLTLLNFFKKKKLSNFGCTKTPNTGEINTRRRRRPTEKTKETLLEGCGGLDGGSVGIVGRTAEDCETDGCSNKSAMSRNGQEELKKITPKLICLHWVDEFCKDSEKIQYFNHISAWKLDYRETNEENINVSNGRYTFHLWAL